MKHQNVPVQAAHGPAAKAQKVRSSRYEWEGKSNNENEKAAGSVAQIAARVRQGDVEEALFRKPRNGSALL